MKGNSFNCKKFGKALTHLSDTVETGGHVSYYIYLDDFVMSEKVSEEAKFNSFVRFPRNGRKLCSIIEIFCNYEIG